MARTKSNVIAPVFTAVASKQKALATRFRKDVDTMRRAVIGQDELQIVLRDIAGLKGEGQLGAFDFVVSPLTYEDSGVTEPTTAYRAPVLKQSITLNIDGSAETLVFYAHSNGQYSLKNGQGDVVLNTGVMKRVINKIEDWRLEMQESYGFDAQKAVQKKVYTQTRTAPGNLERK